MAFNPIRRIKKKKPTYGMLLGGSNIGRPSATGLMAQPQVQRGGGRTAIGGGSSSVSTGPEQTPPEEQGLLGGLLAAKGSYEGGKEALQGGRNLRDYYNKFDFQQDALDPMERDIARMTGGQASDRNLTQQLNRQAGLKNATPISNRPPLKPGNFEGTYTGARGLPSQSGPAPVQNISQMQSMSPPSGVGPAPQFFKGTQVAQGSNLSTGAQGLMGSGASGGALQSAAGGLSKIPTGVSAVNPGTISLNAGGSATVGANSANSIKAAGDVSNTAGSSAGAGAMPYVSGALSVYDMTQNGVNAGNAMALAGTIALANSWNPVGWALMAGSAAYSIFG